MTDVAVRAADVAVGRVTDGRTDVAVVRVAEIKTNVTAIRTAADVRLTQPLSRRGLINELLKALFLSFQHL